MTVSRVHVVRTRLTPRSTVPRGERSYRRDFLLRPYPTFVSSFRTDRERERGRERARDDPRPRNFRPFFTPRRIQQRDSPSDSFARLVAARSRFVHLFSSCIASLETLSWRTDSRSEFRPLSSSLIECIFTYNRLKRKNMNRFGQRTKIPGDEELGARAKMPRRWQV